jgi:hypothetical protein
MKIGQTVECTLGTMKGKKFILVALLTNGFYSCQLVNGDGRYYQYSKANLKES